MARPRKNREPEQLPDVNDGVDHDQLGASHQALNEHSNNLALIEKQFPVDMPYNLELFIARIRQLAVETGARMVEMGNLLIHMKEREAVGDWHDALARIGIAPRYAQRAMQIAVRFGADMQRRQLAATLGATKVLELLTEDDDTIDQLADGGTLAGHTVDELSGMSTRELRELVRKERADRKDEKSADEEIIASKEQKIQRLTRERRSAAKSGPRLLAEEMLSEMDELTVATNSNLHRMRELANEIEAAFDEAGDERPADIIERIDINRRAAADWAGLLAQDLGE